MAASSDYKTNPSDIIGDTARLLAKAMQTKVPCDPIRSVIEPLGVDGAYAVQMAEIAARLAEGSRITGRKIGLTSLVVQQQLGVDQPDFGVLLDDMAFADGAEIPFAGLIQPKLEAEIAFVLEHDLDMDAPSMDQVVRAIAYALPAIEIVDSRIRDWKISIYDTIADNASSGAYVLGDTPVKLQDLDLPACVMTLASRSETLSRGSGASCLSNPLNAVAWLAGRMAALGTPLRAGEVVLSGALGPMIKAAGGEHYTAEISTIGRVTTVFDGGLVP